MHFRDERKKWFRATKATALETGSDKSRIPTEEERQAIEKAAKKSPIGSFAVQKEVGNHNLLAVFVPDQREPLVNEPAPSTQTPDDRSAEPYAPRRVEFVESEPTLGQNGEVVAPPHPEEPKTIVFDDIKNPYETGKTPFDASRITLRSEPKRRS